MQFIAMQSLCSGKYRVGVKYPTPLTKQLKTDDIFTGTNDKL